MNTQSTTPYDPTAYVIISETIGPHEYVQGDNGRCCVGANLHGTCNRPPHDVKLRTNVDNMNTREMLAELVVSFRTVADLLDQAGDSPIIRNMFPGLLT